MGITTNKGMPHATCSCTESNSGTHQPVLLAETLDQLGSVSGRTYLDGTFGGGGYTKALLAAGAAKVLAVDLDQHAAQRAVELGASNLLFFNGNFADLDEHMAKAGIAALDGVVLDLGISSYQLDDPERGMAFRLEGPLDMRLGQTGKTAADILNTAQEKDIADLFYNYGEEHRSRHLAKLICIQRREKKFATTADLLAVIEKLYPRAIPGRRHPAQRLFQALRIAVNEEMAALETVLPKALAALKPGGVLAVVTFHSLEDRVVKHFMRAAAKESPVEGATFKLRTKKPIEPEQAEITANIRARSGKLRAIERAV